MAATKAKPQPLDANNFIVITAMATFVIVILCLVFGKALVGKLVLNNKVIAKKSLAADQLTENINAVSDLVNNYGALPVSPQIIMDSLPTSPDLPAIVGSIEVMTATTGVKFKSVAPAKSAAAKASSSAKTTAGAKPAGPATAQPYQFLVTVEGDYDALLRFYRNLEISSRPYKIITISHSGIGIQQKVDLLIESYHKGPADLSPKYEVVK